MAAERGGGGADVAREGRVVRGGVTGGGVIVVGAGQAAAQLGLSLRAGGFRDRVLMIGAEPFPPYQRPPLSKKFLTERRAPETLLLRPLALWRDQGIELALDTTVAALDLERATLSTVNRQGQTQELTYGTLVLATGTRARVSTAPGAALAGVFSLRSIDDVHRLRPALDAATGIVIVGDRKSTRLNSSHQIISYAVFCLKKKKNDIQ